MMRHKCSSTMVRQEHEPCDVENPNHSDSREPRHTRNGMCRKSFICSGIVVGLLLIVWYTTPEIASWKTSGLSGLRLNRKHGEGDHLADPANCKVIGTDGNLENAISDPQKEIHDREGGFWQGYSENNVPGLHGQNNADHEYHSFGEEREQSKTFENRNSYQPSPGQYQRNKQLPDNSFPGFNNVPQVYNNRYPAYNHRKNYPAYHDQPPSNNYDGNTAYYEDLQSSFDIRNRPESLWKNSGNKIKSPEDPIYKAADKQNLGSVTKISNVLESFAKQPNIEKLAESPPLQSQVRKQETGLRKDLPEQPGKIQDLSIQIADVLLNGQQEQEEVQQPQKQQHPEDQHQQQDHRNTHQSQIQQEKHILNREANSSPHLKAPHQNDAEIEKIKIIAQKDIKNQYSNSDDKSSFYDDTAQQKSASNQKRPVTSDPQVKMGKVSVKQPKEPFVKLRVQPESMAKNVEDWRLPNLYRNQVSQPNVDDVADVETKPRVKKIRASQWGSYQHHRKSQNIDVDLEGFPQALLIGCPESGLGSLIHSQSRKSFCLEI